jgi:membrane protease YdiL (CAAX protease family)
MAGAFDFISGFKSVAVALILFIAVYLPTFAFADIFRNQPTLYVPIVIAVSLGLGLVMICLYHRAGIQFAAFGFQGATFGYLWRAVLFGGPLAFALTYFCHRFDTRSPFGDFVFAPWMVFIFFIVGASLQEEVIFRGLLQTRLMRQRFPNYPRRFPVSPASILVALLFGAIHLPIGWTTAVTAMILGVIAGELRARSSSLLPAILLHMIFNAAGTIW